jgi:hypothetical protein
LQVPVRNFGPTALSSTVGRNFEPGWGERQRVLEKAIADLRQYYFDQEVAQKTADALLAHEQAGDYNAVSDGQAFADLLARHLIDASHDVHFTVEYTQGVFPDFSKPPPPGVEARYRAALEQANCTFDRSKSSRTMLATSSSIRFPMLQRASRRRRQQ